MHIGVVSLKEKLRSFKWNQPLVGEKRVLPLKANSQTAHKASVCFQILFILLEIKYVNLK